MRLFESLNNELKQKNGIYAPYYFRYLGYREDMSADYASLRANGIYSLFTQPNPVILKSEWIAGNKKSLFCDENKLVLNCAKNIVKNFSERSFITNKDHYVPDYEHILRVGLPGMIDEIDMSLQVHQNDSKKVITLLAMKKTLCGFSEMIRKYMLQAEALKMSPDFCKDRLHFIADNCRAIINGPPKSFAQALQLMWFCHTAFLMEGRYAMAFGRMDQYLYRFYKADTSRGVNKTGSGLGLYIVKTIVNRHGGDIYADSKDGRTEFCFTMPANG